MPISLTEEKRVAATQLAEIFRKGQRVCLTTHVSPDGDGLGSEAGLLHLLRARGIEAVVTNPSPTPPRLQFIFDGLPGVDKTADAVKELSRADVIVVLDISDIGRLGALGPVVQPGVVGVEPRGPDNGADFTRGQVDGKGRRIIDPRGGESPAILDLAIRSVFGRPFVDSAEQPAHFEIGQRTYIAQRA